jgi:uncharacterized protein (TIGR03792 family)
MVIEWLKIQIAPGQRERYVQKDEEIWTTFLSQQSGFLSKETWIDPKQSDQVVFIIRWASREAWKAIPPQLLADTDQRFAQALGEISHKIIEAGEYQVRKFPQTRS